LRRMEEHLRHRCLPISSNGKNGSRRQSFDPQVT
jgi:hypothetical protein